MAYRYSFALFSLFLCSTSVSAQRMTRASESASGMQGNLTSVYPALSASGRFVAFDSHASNLVSDDTNADADIFVRDRLLGTITLASRSSSGVQGNGHSGSPSISADGRFVSFSSDATNLVPGDTNATTDVFVRGLQSATTMRVSVDSAGAQANGSSYFHQLSGDGHYVAFSSSASNLVPGDMNGTTDVFVRDLVTGTIVRASVDSAGSQGLGSSGGSPSISSDGRFVAFNSSSRLVPEDADNLRDVYVRDLALGITTLASVGSNGQDADQDASMPSINATGDKVSFLCLSSNLVRDDTNGRRDVFVRDLVLGTTTRVNVSSTGAQANRDAATYPSPISADGRYLVFTSSATNHVKDDTNGEEDVFVRDLLLGRTRMVSAAAFRIPGNGESESPAISDDGRHIAFMSSATNLVPGDTNASQDVFVFSLGVDRVLPR